MSPHVFLSLSAFQRIIFSYRTLQIYLTKVTILTEKTCNFFSKSFPQNSKEKFENRKILMKMHLRFYSKIFWGKFYLKRLQLLHFLMERIRQFVMHMLDLCFLRCNSS